MPNDDGERPVQPILSDGVITLDAFTPEDVPAQLAGEDREQARRFGWHPERSTAAMVRAAIIRWEGDWHTGGATRAFAMRSAATRMLVGGCEVRLKSQGLAEVSYWVFPAHRRRGFSTRGARLLCEYTFRTLRVRRIELHVEADNAASRGVARKLGFHEAGLVPRAPAGGKNTVWPQPVICYVRSAPPPGTDASA